MTRTANRFTKGSSVFACRTCGHKTRDTGRGDNEMVQLCGDCYDLAGEENSLSDSGVFYDTPARILEAIARVASKGDASSWDGMKAKALALTGATVEELLDTPTESTRKRAVAAINDEGDIVQTCYRTAKKYGWTVIAKLY